MALARRAISGDDGERCFSDGALKVLVGRVPIHQEQARPKRESLDHAQELSGRQLGITTVSLPREIGERAALLPLDVTDENAWQRSVADAEDHFGPITILISNPGVQNPRHPHDDTELQLWQQVFMVNLTGHFMAIKHVAPSLRRAGGGPIVAIGSAIAYGGTAFRAQCRQQVGAAGPGEERGPGTGRDNIRVNTIHPGVVATPIGQ